jgi:hypothetical protein
VVIPTLDEASRLPRLLQGLAALSIPRDIIIADLLTLYFAGAAPDRPARWYVPEPPGR